MPQTATNPQTGERFILSNGQWVPMTQTATNPQTGERFGLAGDTWVPIGVAPAAPTPAAAASAAAAPTLLPQQREAMARREAERGFFGRRFDALTGREIEAPRAYTPQELATRQREIATQREQLAARAVEFDRLGREAASQYQSPNAPDRAAGLFQRAQAARDEAAALGRELETITETGVEVPKAQAGREFIGAAPRAFVGGLAAIPGSLTELAGTGLEAIGLNAEGLTEAGRGMREGAQEFFENIFGAPGEALQYDPGAQFASDVSSGVGSIGTFLVPGGAARVAGAGKGLVGAERAAEIARVARPAEYGLGTAQGLEQGIQDVEATEARTGEDISAPRAFAAYLLNAGLGATEVGVATRIFEGIPVARRGAAADTVANVVRRGTAGRVDPTAIGQAVGRTLTDIESRALGRVGVRGAEEALQEGGVQLGTNVIARGLYDSERDVTEGVGYAALVGGTVGGGVRGGVEVTQKVLEARAGTPESTALAADPAIRAEFQKLAGQEVAAVMAANPELDQQAAVNIVEGRAKELLVRAAGNVLNARSEGVAPPTQGTEDVVSDGQPSGAGVSGSDVRSGLGGTAAGPEGTTARNVGVFGGAPTVNVQGQGNVDGALASQQVLSGVFENMPDNFTEQQQRAAMTAAEYALTGAAFDTAPLTNLDEDTRAAVDYGTNKANELFALTRPPAPTPEGAAPSTAQQGQKDFVAGVQQGFDSLESDLDQLRADMKAAEAAATAPETPGAGFKTAMGSTYTVDEEGRTTRTKAERDTPGHEGDFGRKPTSAKTVYVDSTDQAAALSAAGLQGLDKKGARVVIKNGKATLLTWNQKENRWGSTPSSRGIPVYSEPAVGRAPLELWGPAKDVPGYEAYRKMHAGNQITELFGSAPEGAAPATPTPEVAAPAAVPIRTSGGLSTKSLNADIDAFEAANRDWSGTADAVATMREAVANPNLTVRQRREAIDAKIADAAAPKAAPAPEAVTKKARKAKQVTRSAEAAGSIVGGTKVDIDAFRGRTVADLLDHIGANEAGKYSAFDVNLADRLLEPLFEIQDAGFSITLNVVQEGDKALPRSVAVGNALGLVVTNVETRTVDLYLRSPTIGNSGDSTEIILHEALHAVSVGILLAAESGRGTPKMLRFRKDLFDLREKVIKHFNNRFKRLGLDGLTDFERSIYTRSTNAFVNLDEFLAWGMTNKLAQDYLRSIEIGPKKSLFDEFVDAFRALLGISPNDTSALAHLVDIVSPLFSATAQDYRATILERGGTTTTAMAVAPEGGAVFDVPENAVNLTEEPRNTDIMALAEELPEAARVNVRARLDRIIELYNRRGDVQRLLGSLEELRQDVDQRIYRDLEKRARPRVRGFERAMEVIYRAERNGQLSPEGAGLIRWLLQQNPAIAEELAISIREGGNAAPAGQYVPAARLVTIFSSRANDGTAAHEVLHHAERLMPDRVRDGIRAAWMKRIQDLIALTERDGNTNAREVLGTIVEAYYGDAAAQKALKEAFDSGSIPYSMYHLSNPSEFWAVNATALVGRRARQTGWVGAARNWLRGLTEKAKDLFGLPNDAAVIAGLNAVLRAESGAVRGDMLSAGMTEFMDQSAPEGGTEPITPANVDKVVSVKLTKAQINLLERAAGIQRAKLNAMQKRIARSRSAEETMGLAGKLMLATRKAGEAVDILTSLFPSVPPPILQALLSPLETADVVRLGKRAGMKNVTLIDNMVRDEYVPYVNRIMAKASKLAEKWTDFMSRLPEGANAMAEVMVLSNMLDADPSLAPTAAEYLKIDQTFKAISARLAAETDPKRQSTLKGELTKRRGEIERLYFGGTDPDGTTVAGWNDIPPQGKQIFREARDYYRADFKEHYRLLMQRIDDAQFKPEDAERLKAAVDAMFNEAATRVIYFPMKRFGDYWVSVGKGASSEFYMFEQASAQDAFIARLKREGETRDISFSQGRDTLRLGLRNKTADASSALKDILNLIDGGGIGDVDILKDHIFQMYLTALPEGDMRRRFIHRQFTTGFSMDALRTFASTAIASANQLGRLAYDYKLQNLIDQSYAETEGKPSKRRLDTITRELELRIADTMSSDPDNFWSQLANLGAKATFLFILTSPASAALNLTQLHVVGLPTLAAEFGEGATLAMAARYTKEVLTGDRIANPFRDEEGNLQLQMPEFTTERGAYIDGLRETDPDRHKAIVMAWEYAREREITESTFSSAANVYESSDRPSGELSFTQAARQGNAALAVQRATANTVNGMGALFHHTERMGREIMYMSAFEMAYDRALAQGKTPTEARNIAMPMAAELTNKGMFDFSNWNKSRAAKNPVGKLALQMRAYTISMTSLLFRSFMKMLPFMGNTKAEMLAAARVFVGVGAMTTLYGGLRASQFYVMGKFASMLGMLGFGLLKAIESAFKGDDDDEEEVEQGYLNPETIERETLKYAAGPGRELSKKDWDFYIRTVWIPETFGKGGTMQEALGLSDATADKLATVADIGLPGLFKVDISSNVSLTNLWYPIETQSDDPQVRPYEMIGRGLLGPSASLIGAGAKVFTELDVGNIRGAIEAVMPKAIRGFVTAERLKDEGLVIGKNRDIVLRDPSFYDVYTLAMTSLGFREAETSRDMQLSIRAGEIEREITSAKTKLFDRRYRAARAADQANPTEEQIRALRDVERDIQIYNLNYPSNAISGEAMQRSYEEKASEAGERMYGLGINPKIPIRQSMVDERTEEFLSGQ